MLNLRKIYGSSKCWDRLSRSSSGASRVTRPKSVFLCESKRFYRNNRVDKYLYFVQIGQESKSKRSSVSRLCISPDVHMLALEVVARTPKTVSSLYSLFGSGQRTAGGPARGPCKAHALAHTWHACARHSLACAAARSPQPAAWTG